MQALGPNGNIFGLVRGTIVESFGERCIQKLPVKLVMGGGGFVRGVKATGSWCNKIKKNKIRTKTKMK
jgi:hypothetical protein